jgi:spore germination cell wall hydrolase CwlJ-like protein|tara:strand:- start:187 stop:588 length:402 start_codon:yes stop_codon:yes gene_type:complete
MLAATCLALNVYFESRSEASVLSQFAVAQVTMNRVMSDKYPNSICDVVWQKGQFSWTHDGKSDKPYEKQAWDRAQWVAKVTLDNPKKSMGLLPTNALHYHADYVQPFWSKSKSLTRITKIGRHYFYTTLEKDK